MTHLCLLGDSIFDNGRYVPGEPDVAAQLRTAMAPDDEVTLLALDGAVTENVAAQLRQLPAKASHIVVSTGGNDALSASHLLGARVESVVEAVALLGEAQQAFADSYDRMVSGLAGAGRPTALCTIYDTPSDAPGQPMIRTALALFNDVITRAAFRHGHALIDLRLICSDDADYANPIEPSARGGAKIAAAIAAWARGAATSSVVAASAQP